MKTRLFVSIFFLELNMRSTSMSHSISNEFRRQIWFFFSIFLNLASSFRTDFPSIRTDDIRASQINTILIIFRPCILHHIFELLPLQRSIYSHFSKVPKKLMFDWQWADASALTALMRKFSSICPSKKLTRSCRSLTRKSNIPLQSPKLFY